MLLRARRSASSLRLLCLAGFLGAVVSPEPGYSDPAVTAPKATATDDSKSQESNGEDDFDRELMGEFAGPVALAPNRYQATAVQIRAIGEGGFEGIQYVGGLPGDRTFRGDALTLIGKRAGDFLVLSGAAWAIFVEKDVCVVVDRTGKELGRLQRIVRQSPTLGAAAPQNATVLFDGSGTEQFTVAELTEEGLLTEGADFKEMFHDFNLHLEFWLPYMPTMRGQARGNSGIYLQSRYELQILDSFATEPVFDGCGSLYRFRKPDLNMCFPPLQWQTYDLVFTSPRWASDGTKLKNARITAWLNGVKVQDNVELADKTGHGEPEEPVLLPIRLQNHNCPVRYRNIWIIDRGLSNVGQFPIPGKPAPKTDEPPQKMPQDKPAAGPEARKVSEKSAPPEPEQTAVMKEAAEPEKASMTSGKASGKDETKSDKPAGQPTEKEPKKAPAAAKAKESPKAETADAKEASPQKEVSGDNPADGESSKAAESKPTPEPPKNASAAEPNKS
ncbi:MAG: DUF1080 domain-containing protein [Rhodopirellula sp.]|nr:DUF1080 domain-containing protein [Rhodopirellula sp.]